MECKLGLSREGSWGFVWFRLVNHLLSLAVCSGNMFVDLVSGGSDFHSLTCPTSPKKSNWMC